MVVRSVKFRDLLGGQRGMLHVTLYRYDGHAEIEFDFGRGFVRMNQRQVRALTNYLQEWVPPTTPGTGSDSSWNPNPGTTPGGGTGSCKGTTPGTVSYPPPPVPPPVPQPLPDPMGVMSAAMPPAENVPAPPAARASRKRTTPKT
jgi:hypothetical protein